MDDLLTRRDVERRVRLSRSRIYALMRLGEFPLPFRIGQSRGALELWRNREMARRASAGGYSPGGLTLKAPCRVGDPASWGSGEALAQSAINGCPSAYQKTQVRGNGRTATATTTTARKWRIRPRSISACPGASVLYCNVLVPLRHAKEKRRAYAATKTIAEQTRLGRSSIVRALKTLQEHNLIFAVKREHRRPTIFRLTDCFYEYEDDDNEDDDNE